LGDQVNSEDLQQAFLDRLRASNREREGRFVDEYMIDMNGTKAATRAGYTGNCATVAWNLLQKRDVRDEIDRRIAEGRARAVITVAQIEGMLLDLATVEPLDIWDEHGNVRPLQDIPPNARRAIKSIRRTQKEHPITGVTEDKIEIEMWDKKGAIELLGKYKKMFTEKVEHSGEVNTKVAFSINGVIK
jgi:phage terminase small subunit